MYKELKEAVFQANLELPEMGLVAFTWGNVSARDPETGVIAIKPSGVPYKTMKSSDIVVVDSEGKILEGTLKPSSDLPTHLELYKHFKTIGGIVHTHSITATAWAQACRAIPDLGTTHGDYFYGEIPCTHILTERQTGGGQYELETGWAIVERFRELGLEPANMPAVLVANHGPFTWGKDGHEAVHNAAVLELTAQMALLTIQLNPEQDSMPRHLLNKHFFRKHGPNAYYGQN